VRRKTSRRGLWRVNQKNEEGVVEIQRPSRSIYNGRETRCWRRAKGRTKNKGEKDRELKIGSLSFKKPKAEGYEERVPGGRKVKL